MTSQATLKDKKRRGRTLIPGFNDAHCHILAFASSLLSVDCSPSVVSSITDIKAQIHKQAQKLTRGTWIRATGYNEFYLAEKRHPNRDDLDEAAPHHPVKLMHRSSHACVLNSIALSLIGISNETQEPHLPYRKRNWRKGLGLSIRNVYRTASPPFKMPPSIMGRSSLVPCKDSGSVAFWYPGYR